MGGATRGRQDADGARRSGGRWRIRTAFRAILLAMATLVMTMPSDAHPRPSGPYVVIDAATGETLAQSRSRQRAHPASLTKMMTLYLSFEALERGALSPTQLLRVSRHAASMPPSELGLKAGDRISVRDAVRGSAVRSANDAAVVLAEAIGGDEARFARLMTEKARALGMRDTTFRNASGLTATGHLSTPHDMGILARRLHQDFQDYYWMFSRRSMRIRGLRYRATNTLLGVSPGVDGIKTGYTRAAGHNLAASAYRKGARVTVVLMGAPSRPRRDRDVMRLLDRGFARLDALQRSRDLRDRQRRDRDRRRDDMLVALGTAPTPRPRPGAAGAAEAPLTLVTRAPASLRQGGVPAAAALAWRVQIGAFRDAAGAERALARVAAQSSATGATPQVERVAKDGGGAIYRARLGTLDEAGARRICAALKQAQKPCALVPPTGWAQLASR